MLELEPRGSFADLGCGSGVLAIAAAKLGFAPVAAVDSDAARDRGDARERARQRRACSTASSGGTCAATRRRRALTVAANLMRPLLLQLAPRLERPDALILSGLLEHEADEVAAAFAPLRERRRLGDKGWAALLLTASS